MKNLKLNKLADQSLDTKEMNNLRGGHPCRCFCSTGGRSTISDNLRSTSHGETIAMEICWYPFVDEEGGTGIAEPKQ